MKSLESITFFIRKKNFCIESISTPIACRHLSQETFFQWFFDYLKWDAYSPQAFSLEYIYAELLVC